LVAVGTASPEPLKPDELPLDSKQTFAWPMDPTTSTVRNGSRLNKVLLLRLDPEGFDPETKEHAADGVVAYSAICVNTGCDVTPISSCSNAPAIIPLTILATAVERQDLPIAAISRTQSKGRNGSEPAIRLRRVDCCRPEVAGNLAPILATAASRVSYRAAS
jgi:hypothetical protein